MVNNDLSELDISEGENKIHLKRGGAVVAAAPVPMPLVAQPPSAGSGVAPTPVRVPQERIAAPAGEKLVEIRSPMVERSMPPQSRTAILHPYRSGRVRRHVVCIVEAMKVMKRDQGRVLRNHRRSVRKERATGRGTGRSFSRSNRKFVVLPVREFFLNRLTRTTNG